MRVRVAVPLCLAAVCLCACSDEGHLGSRSSHAGHRLLGGAEAGVGPPVAGIGSGCGGVLLHPRVVIYSAHCGTGVDSVTVGAVEFRTILCEAAPSDGSIAKDLAYCLLESPAPTDAVAVPALGCELSSVVPGALLTVKGRGLPNMDELEAQVKVDSVSDGLTVSAKGVAACGGDSGGPVLVHLASSTQSALRLVGIVSRGSANCIAEEGSIYVTPVGALVPWLEARTSIDFSPCGSADGAWAPTPACRSEQGSFWDFCGAPVGVPGEDSTAPNVAIREIRTSESAGTFDINVKVEATDVGWGVQEVGLSILDGAGQSTWEVQRSFEPFEFTDIRLAPGAYRVEVSAVDFAGNHAGSAEQLQLRNSSPSSGECTTSVGASSRKSASVWLFVAAIALSAACTRRNRRGVRCCSTTNDGGR